MNSEKARLNALTSFRGFAAWWVVLYHIRDYIHLPWLEGFLSQGYLAVDFFFILSGFIISYAYFEKCKSASKRDIVAFYLKRLNRIYPLHFIILIAYTAIPFIYFMTDRILPNTDKYSFIYFISAIFLSHNWGWFSELAWNVPSWSISTELFAYLFFPLLVTLFVKFPKKHHALLIALACFIAIPLIYNLNGSNDIGEGIATLGVYRCILEFSIGMCCFSLYKQGKPLPDYLAVVGFLVCLAAFFQLPQLLGYGSSLFIIPIAGAGVLYTALNLPVYTLKPFLNRWVLYQGEISYSIYLLHYFVLDIFKILTPSYEFIGPTWILFYLVTLFITAATTYRLVENSMRRFLNNKVDNLITTRS